MIAADRARSVERLQHIRRQIAVLADRLRHPGHDPEVSADLWHLCAAHDRALREMASRRTPRHTQQVAPLPRDGDPAYAIGIVPELARYLDRAR